MNFRLLAVLLCVTGSIQLGESKDSNTTAAHDLWYEIFVTRGYSPEIRPVYDQFYTTDIAVEVHLKTINYFDEVSEILKVSCYMYIEWWDEFLVWNTSDFENITLIRWPQDDIWRPDLTHYNSVNSYKSLGHSTLLVESYDDGYISWKPMEVFETSCPVDMTYFPFDIQTCTLEFISWSYSNDQVTLYPLYDTIDLEDFSQNPQWEIISTSVSVKNRSSGVLVDIITYKITMQRKPQYYLLTLFLPIILLAVLNICVFVLPSDGGERSGYAVTIVLSFAVFLTIVETTMPANSEKVSLFSVYVMVQTIQSTLTTVISLLVIRCASLDERTRIPKVLIKVVHRLSRGKSSCKTTKVEQMHTEKAKCEVQSISGQDESSDECSVIEETYTWKIVADTVDKVSFIVFTMIFILTTVIGIMVLSLVPS